jgi:Right handed beta helix region
MRLRGTPTVTGSEPPREATERLPHTLTLLEAAALTKTDPDALWQQIRSGQIPFTLVSARKDRGTSVLVCTEHLIRAGLLSQPGGPQWERSQSPASVPLPASRGAFVASRPAATPPQGRVSAIRIGAYTGTAIAATIAVLLLALLIPSLISRQPSETVSSGLAGSVESICRSQPKSKACRDAARSRSRTPVRSTSRSGPGSRTVTKAPSTVPAPGSRVGSHAPSGSSNASGGPAPQPSPSASPPPPDGYNGYRVPPGIPANCSRDVTSDLLAWINAVPDQSTLLFPMSACYRIDGTLTISHRTGLTFAGNGTTLNGKYHTQGNAPHVRIYLSKGITITDMIVKGANPKAGIGDDAFQVDLQWEAAYEISGSENVLLTSVQAYDVFGDFVTIEPEWVRPNYLTARNVTVQNSRFERNGRMGISITGGEDITIRNNYIGQVRHVLLDLETHWTALRVANVRFTGNRTGAVRLGWMANGGECNAGVSNIYVADNVMEADAGLPLFWVKTPSGCARRGPFTLERNKLIARPSSRAVLLFTKGQDMTVRNNEVRFYRDARPRILVNLVTSTRATVMDNIGIADPRDTVVWVSADAESDYVSYGNKRM